MSKRIQDMIKENDIENNNTQNNKEDSISKIIVYGLTHDYGQGRGVFDVNLEVKEGETLGFLGPNGAGKSTTIRHLCGFSKPQKGTVIIDGCNCTKQYNEIMKKVGYLPGEVALPSGLKGYEFIEMMKKMKGCEDDKRIKELSERFKLETDMNVDKMSVGEKRKLAVVTAFMNDPEILLLDEPTSGLDPMMQEEFIKFILEEKKRGKTILLSSHIFSEVEALCDRITIIKDGVIVSTVDSAEIKHGLHNIMRFNLKSSQDLEKLKEENLELSIINKDELQCEVVVDDRDINSFISKISKYRIKNFEEHSVSLEEYFMKFYKTDRKNFKIIY